MRFQEICFSIKSLGDNNPTKVNACEASTFGEGFQWQVTNIFSSMNFKDCSWALFFFFFLIDMIYKKKKKKKKGTKKELPKKYVIYKPLTH
jgi:hypothetical protein